MRCRWQRIFAHVGRQLAVRTLYLGENHDGEVYQFAKRAAAVKKRGVHLIDPISTGVLRKKHDPGRADPAARLAPSCGMIAA